MSEAFTDADYERVVRERDDALARIDSQRSQIAFYRTACTARFLPDGFGDETIRELINDLMEDRDDARSTIEDLSDEIARGREAIRIYRTETEAAKRERDLALGRLENEIKAAKQARMAEERARESLDELDAAIYECLPSDYDDDSPLDCVEHAADRLRELAEERDGWRDKYHALDQTAGELCDACGWRFKIPCEQCRCEVVRERDEARAEVDRLRERCETLANNHEYRVEELAARRDEHKAKREEYAAEARSLRERLKDAYRERDEARAEVERLREMAHDFEAMRQDRDEAQEAYREARASRWHVSKKWDEALKEIERLRTENRDMSRAITDAIEIQRNACADAYRRGAEAMREACQQWCRAWENDGEAIADALADLRVEDP